MQVAGGSLFSTEAPHTQNGIFCLDRAGVQVRVEGVALCWRDGQAVYVPIRGTPELLAELAPLFGSRKLEKATFDLKSQLAQLVRAHGRAVLGMEQQQGAAAPAGEAGGWLTWPSVQRTRC
jgi:hypothetical protein